MLIIHSVYLFLKNNSLKSRKEVSPWRDTILDRWRINMLLPTIYLMEDLFREERLAGGERPKFAKGEAKSHRYKKFLPEVKCVLSL